MFIMYLNKRHNYKDYAILSVNELVYGTTKRAGIQGQSERLNYVCK